MKTKVPSFIMVFVICSITVYSQSIVNGGSGQGMINLVPDNGFVPKNGFKNIKPDGSLGFWRLRILPERLSTALQEIQVTYEFSIDQPTTIRGYNANGGEIFYDPADFQITIAGSMDFVIKGHYTDPSTGKQHTFEDKRYISKLGNTVTKGALFTYGPEMVSAMVKLKEITQEAITLEVFLQKFKVRVTSIEAVSRHYSGFSDLDIKIGRMLDKKREEAKFNTLLADAQNAESFGRMDEAIQKYEEAYKIKQDPVVKAKIEELKAKKQTEAEAAKQNAETEAQAKKEAETSESNLDNGSTNRSQEVVDNFDHTIPKNQMSKELDFFGNPVISKTEDGETKTVSYAGMEVENNEHYQQQMELRQNNTYAREQHQLQEAENRRQVDHHNNALYQQSNDIYQQSLTIDKDMNEALAQISPETYGDPKAMIKTGMSLLSTANGNLGQAYTGAALSGVGLAAGLLGDLAKAKAKKEAAAERARLRKEAEAKKNAIRESIKKARLAVFKGYPQGELPLSSTTSKGNNLYYFVYAYNQDQLMLDNPKVKATNVFAIGKYPDGTWPMKTKIEDEVNNLTPLQETICGPFYSLSEANSVYNSFLSYIDKTNMGIDTITYEGFNAHSETENLQQTAPKLDFWGNPIKN